MDPLSYAREVFSIEADALNQVAARLDHQFEAAVKLILDCKARVIVCGIGKSGIIGHKIAATFASTGTPSFFMHPAEAFHGDIGLVRKEDVVLLISYSGETEEIIRILPFFKENGNRIISMTGSGRSTLATASDHHLDVRIEKEACPLRMAPTTSTTATLAMGDALAMVLMKQRGFKAEDFARYHRGGALGRKLFTKVEEVMVKSQLPVVHGTDLMKEVLSVMTSGRLGTAVVVDAENRVLGIITDGDLRRGLNKHKDVLNQRADAIMSKNPKTGSKDLLVHEAEQILIRNQINALPICDAENRLLGILLFHTH